MREKKPRQSIEWKWNIWTGQDLGRVTDNGRIIRQKYYNPISYLYRAEFWGDYSLERPTYGPWRKTLKAALRDLRDLEEADRYEREQRALAAADAAGGVTDQPGPFDHAQQPSKGD